MKDLGLMHYFLGLEVWQKDGQIFLAQGKYVVEILKRFGMQDCRPMATPMVTNWKKIDASKSKGVDATLYRQLIGPLTYLVNTRPDLCFVVNTLSQFMVEPKHVHWVAAKTCVEVFAWDSRVWIELYPRGWSEARELFGCKLGRQ
jgi:hypothetical protein